MTTPVDYEGHHGQVCWRGLSLEEGEEFAEFLEKDVADIVRDAVGQEQFETHLDSLATTGFEQKSLRAILDAHVPEERDWAVGEAIAEAHLARHHGVVWPWNTDRDKKVRQASLPGADLVGFVLEATDTFLALGEVKSSSDQETPPNVMYGRSGMTHQIDNIANDLTVLGSLVRWLFFRCKGTKHEKYYNAAVKRLFGSGNRAIHLFGVLIRDTKPSEADLRARGTALAKCVHSPTSCTLTAIHLPCSISTLPNRISVGRS